MTLTDPSAPSPSPASEPAAPRDPLAAVVHPDPYPYYRRLRENAPFERNEELRAWVAASAEAVTEVLSSGLCRVRPTAEPVPPAIAGSPSGEIFGRLVRQTDGGERERWKGEIAARIDRWFDGSPGAAGGEGLARGISLSETIGRRARGLVAALGPERSPSALDAFLFALPVQAVASRLGVPEGELPEVAERVGELVAGFAPLAAPEAVERGRVVASGLLDRFRALRVGRSQRAGGSGSGLAIPPGVGRSEGGGVAPSAELAAIATANEIGLLIQGYEATAGLIGNGLIALARGPERERAARHEPGFLPPFLREVARFDPPVQNTRRFVAEDGVLAGREVRAGEAILVVLAAANRDPAANPDPDRFDPRRRVGRLFTFGLGAHACPGERLATSIAAAGIAALLAAGLDHRPLAGEIQYRPSLNARLPRFAVRRLH